MTAHDIARILAITAIVVGLINVISTALKWPPSNPKAYVIFVGLVLMSSIMTLIRMG